MQQLVPMYIVIAFIVALSSKSEAKRGCALYGHSCYGGHGKRSDIPLQQPLNAADSNTIIKSFSEPNKEVPFPLYNMRTGNSALEQENRQLVEFIKQLIEYRRAAPPIEEPDNMNEVIFQRNK